MLHGMHSNFSSRDCVLCFSYFEPQCLTFLGRFNVPVCAHKFILNGPCGRCRRLVTWPLLLSCRAVGIARFGAQVGWPRMVDEGLQSEQRGRREEGRGREEGGVEVLGVVLEIVGLVLEGPGGDPGASGGSSWMSWGVVLDC